MRSQSLFSTVMILVIAIAISPEEASKHVGEDWDVCGTIASTRFVESASGGRTYLNFSNASPNQPFYALISGTDRSKLEALEKSCLGKGACVTGKIERFHGKLRMILRNRDHLSGC